MKKILSLLATALVFIMLTNCGMQTSVPADVQREWMLVEFQDFNKELMVNSKARLSLTKQQDAANEFSANMGCNSMFGKAVFSSNGTVRFSDIGSTMMYCDKSMDLETAFAKELPKMIKYTVKGHFLTLTDGVGKQMKFVAAD